MAQQRHMSLWQNLVSSEITGPQFGVIAALHRSPGLSQADLCLELDLDRSTIADLIGRLVDREIVTREDHDVDKRRYSLSLSELGEAEYTQLEPRVSALDKALTKNLSAQEHDELQRLLKLVVS
jgi:DNA-binding MarR family transcriptional regulator